MKVFHAVVLKVMLFNSKVLALTIATGCVLIAVYTIYSQRNIKSTKSVNNTMTDSDDKSLGLSTNTSGNNSNLSALSTASKMNKSKNKNKIPRGATGTMPGKSANDLKNKPKTIIGFKDNKPNIDEKDNNNRNQAGIIWDEIYIYNYY